MRRQSVLFSVVVAGDIIFLSLFLFSLPLSNGPRVSRRQGRTKVNRRDKEDCGEMLLTRRIPPQRGGGDRRQQLPTSFSSISCETRKECRGGFFLKKNQERELTTSTSTTSSPESKAIDESLKLIILFFFFLRLSFLAIQPTCALSSIF